MAENKLRVDLIAPEMIEAIAEVMGIAAESGKYPERSWETDPKYTYMKHIASILRHTLAVMKGEDIDDDGLLHADHIATRGGMLATMQRRKRIDLDDRPSQQQRFKVDLWKEYMTASQNIGHKDYNPVTQEDK